MSKPRIGISACLLGKKVRHDGGDKRNGWIIDSLGPFVDFVPLCPEMEMGLGVPRKTLRLIGTTENPQLIVNGTEENITQHASNTTEKIFAIDYNLDSFILKKDSPSCGLERVKIYDKNNCPSRSATGIFANILKKKFPLMPMIEEGRLSDVKQRELYVVKLFAYAQLRKLELSVHALQLFHQHYKYLLMAYAPSCYSKLGNIAANSAKKDLIQVFAEYHKLFAQIMAYTPSRKQWTNVLRHMLGYFKTVLNASEKQQLLGTIEEYRRSELPLIAALTLFKHLAEKHSITYLKEQALYEPYPKELKNLEN